MHPMICTFFSLLLSLLILYVFPFLVLVRIFRDFLPLSCSFCVFLSCFLDSCFLTLRQSFKSIFIPSNSGHIDINWPKTVDIVHHYKCNRKVGAGPSIPNLCSLFLLDKVWLRSVSSTLRPKVVPSKKTIDQIEFFFNGVYYLELCNVHNIILK